MSKPWPNVQLSKVTDPTKSWSPERDSPKSTFKYIDLSAVDNDQKLIVDSKSLLGSEAPSRARQRLQTGDILVSTVRPNLNAVAIVPPELDGSTGSTGFCVLRPGSGLEGRYLFQWVKSPMFVAEMTRLATGASYPAVSDRIILNSLIPRPPIEEQRRIAAILDKADEIRTKRRAALAQLDTLTQAIFLDLFGDPAVNSKRWPAGSVRSLLESASYGTSTKSEMTGSVPVLRMNNITYAGGVDLRNLKYMELGASEFDRYTVRHGDVLFNRTNSADLVGKSAMYTGTTPMAYAGYLIRLRVNIENTPHYLAGFLNASSTKKTLRNMCKSIIGMANINATEVQNMQLPLPPLEVQLAYREKYEAAAAQKPQLTTAIECADHLFSSSAQSISGRCVVARTGNNVLVFRAMEWRDPIRGTAEDPYFVTLDAIGKKNEEGTASVAIEFLCNRLALMVGLPVPPGALTQTTEGNIAFVSLRFGSLSELPTRIAPDEFVQDNSRIDRLGQQPFNRHGGFR